MTTQQIADILNRLNRWDLSDSIQGIDEPNYMEVKDAKNGDFIRIDDLATAFDLMINVGTNEFVT